jgi:hypothetical protein
VVMVTAAVAVTLAEVLLPVVIIVAAALVPSARYAVKLVTPPSGVGTGWMTCTRMKLLQQPWRLHNHT